MDDPLVADLKNQIATGQAIAMVGSGVSISATLGAPTASWIGLLRDGIERCEALGHPKPRAGWGDRQRAALERGDTSDLLEVAKQITSRLGTSEWRRWLRETVGALKAQDRGVLEALRDLRIPIATTNYDHLIEEVTGWPAVTWRDSARAERVIRGDEEGVLHLYGDWQTPESVVLDVRSYKAVLDDAHAQTVLRVLRIKQTRVFIGYGGRGLDAWTRQVREGPECRDFLLCRASDREAAQTLHPPEERVFAVSFGENYQDLEPFLRSLAPSRRGTSLASLPELRSGVLPDSVEGDDAVDVTADAASFARLITDNEVEPPLAIGVFGEWGSGKSFFMRLLRDKVKDIGASNSDGFCQAVVQIEFNAWHYVEANLWASLVYRIFSRLHAHLEQRREASEAERLFAQLETAKQLKAEAEKRLSEARKLLSTAERRLQDRQKAAKHQLSLKLLAREKIWENLRTENLPEPLQVKIRQFRKEAGIEQALDSGRELRNALDEFRGISGRLQLLYGGWQRLSAGRRIASALLLVIAAWIVFDFGGSFSTYIFPGVAGLVGKLTAAAGLLAAGLHMLARHGRTVISLAEWLEEALKDQQAVEQEAQVQALNVKVREAEQQIAEAEAEVERAQVAVVEASLPRRIARFVEERIAAGQYQKHLGIVAMVREDFERLSDLMALKHGKKPQRQVEIDSDTLNALPLIDRIVLYIDDLDRCPTTQVVQVLEAIHLLLAFPLFVVVVGLDVRWAQRSLLDHYPRHLVSSDPGPIFIDDEAASNSKADQALGTDAESLMRDQATPHDYLEKIFQIPFWLQPLEGSSSRRLLESLTQARTLKSEPAPGPNAAEKDGDGSRPLAPNAEAAEGRKLEARNLVHGGPLEETGALIRAEPEGASAPPPPPPEPLVFDRSERAFMLDLAPYAGTSPRRAKRFLNVYRVVKAGLSLEERRGFVVDDGRLGSYRAAMTLLALTTGAPHLARPIFGLLRQAKAADKVDLIMKKIEATSEPLDPRERNAALGALRKYIEASPGSVGVADLKAWLPKVSRFTFRFGRS